MKTEEAKEELQEKLDVSDEGEEKSKSSEGGSPKARPQDKSKSAGSSYDSEEDVDDVLNELENSEQLNHLIIFNKQKKVLLTVEITKKISLKQLDIVSLKKSLLDQKMQDEEIYQTSNGNFEDWTSVYENSGLFVSGLFAKKIAISDRVDLLMVLGL